MVAVLVLVSLPVGLLLSYSQSSGFFLFGNLASLRSSLDGSNTGPIILTDVAPGYDAILAVTHEVTGMDFLALVYLPVGILLAPITFFVALRRIFRDPKIPFVLSLYLVFDIAQTGWYNTFAYSWVRIVYLAAFMVLIINLQGRRVPSYVVALLPLFAGASLIHYTPPVWIIVFIVAAVAVTRLAHPQTSPRWLTTLALVIVIYLTLNQTVYKVFVPSFAHSITDSGLVDPFASFVSRLQTLFLGQSVSGGEFSYQPSLGVYGTLRVLLNVAILVPALVTLPRAVRGLWKSGGLSGRANSQLVALTVYWGLLATTVVQALIYGTVVQISSQVLLFLGPVMAVVLLAKTDKEKRARMAAVLLIAALSVSTFAIDALTEKLVPTYRDLEPSADFLSNATPFGRAPVLANIDVLYYINYAASGRNKTIRFVYFNGATYGELLDECALSTHSWDFLVIDRHAMLAFVRGERLTYYQPLYLHLDRIEMNPGLAGIYSDSQVVIMYRSCVT